VPELPEVEALARFLGERAVGDVVARVDLGHVSALKTYDPPLDTLVGRAFTATGRRGKFLLLEADGIWLVLHLARAGWLRWRDKITTTPIKRSKGSPLALRVALASGAGFEATEHGKEKRLAVYVVTDPNAVEGITRLGPDALTLSRAALAERLTGRNAQLKGVLTDQEILAGIGNAYSDEILHAAGLSPFKAAAKLTDAEVERLHDAMVTTLRDAADRSMGLPAKDLKDEKRAGMRVHGRAGLPCPLCGDDVREVSFATSALQYCATCQTGGKPLADRRFSRLVK
jgi:formamidopyrimidine-DNA glycosylase